MSILIWVVSASTNRKSPCSPPFPKHVFLFFHAEITPVHWSLIIPAYVTLSRALSCNRLWQKPVSSQTKGLVGSQQRETNSSRHVQYCRRGHNKQELFTLTSLDMLAAPHAAASVSACCCCDLKTWLLHLFFFFFIKRRCIKTHQMRLEMCCLQAVNTSCLGFNLTIMWRRAKCHQRGRRRWNDSSGQAGVFADEGVNHVTIVPPHKHFKRSQQERINFMFLGQYFFCVCVCVLLLLRDISENALMGLISNRNTFFFRFLAKLQMVLLSRQNLNLKWMTIGFLWDLFKCCMQWCNIHKDWDGHVLHI